VSGNEHRTSTYKAEWLETPTASAVHRFVLVYTHAPFFLVLACFVSFLLVLSRSLSLSLSCPTEIRAFSDRAAEFEKLGASVVAASVDSEYAHLAWTRQDRKEGGLGPMKIPILADVNKSISRSYGVLLEKEGIALRGQRGVQTD
jgi:hypothetical protein